MERQQRNTLSEHKNTRIFNKEFTLFSRATSLVQLSVVALFYCVFKQRITMQGLNVSSPEAGLLGRVVLGFSKPLECTDSSYFYQFCDLRVYSGKSQI